MSSAVTIGHRRIGDGHPCFVIAEAGVNHNGDEQLATRLVDAAADAGADAVKFQTFEADELVAPGARKAGYQQTAGPDGESQLAMLRRLQLAPDVFARLRDHCERRSIQFLSSPFDAGSLRLLDELDVPAIKLGSGELTNLPLIEAAAATGRPLIVSTGMATLDEVEAAVAVARASAGGVIVLHCVSRYPAPPELSNLKAIVTLRDALGVPVGYSDHALGSDVSLAAVALGACVIEKHLTLDRELPGPDHAASLEPDAMKAMIASIRTVESALGTGRKEPAPGEDEIAAVARKSLVARRDLPAGHVLAEGDLAVRRPGHGLPPSALATTLGRILTRPHVAGEVLVSDSIA